MDGRTDSPGEGGGEGGRIVVKKGEETVLRVYEGEEKLRKG